MIRYSLFVSITINPSRPTGMTCDPKTGAILLPPISLSKYVPSAYRNLHVAASRLLHRGLMFHIVHETEHLQLDVLGDFPPGLKDSTFSWCFCARNPHDMHLLCLMRWDGFGTTPTSKQQRRKQGNRSRKRGPAMMYVGIGYEVSGDA